MTGKTRKKLIKKIRILIVDDENIVLNFFKRLLKYKNCDISAVKTGEEALALVKAKKFDILFLDILLKETNGIDLYKKIRKIQPRLNTILITGELSQAHIEGLDIKGCFSKPFDIKQILDVLAQIRPKK